MSLIRDCSCIPSSPSGYQLKYPKELIHPYRKAARLYEPSDGKFPYGAFSTEGRLLKLKKLGLREDNQEWEEIIERAQSVQALSDYDQSVRRTKVLLEFIDTKLKKNSNVPCGIRTRLQQIPFLPILRRPKSYPFRWKGDDHSETSFLSAISLYPKKLKYLVGACAPILDEKSIDASYKVLKFLEITKNVTIDQAKVQLKNVIEINQAEGKSVIEEVEKACEELYEYFQCFPSDQKEQVRTVLKPMKFILIGSYFLPASQVALSGDLNFAPYLCSLPSKWLKFGALFNLLCVRQSFEIVDYVSALKNVKEDYGGKALDDDIINKVVSVLNLLCKVMEAKQVSFKEVVAKHGKIFFPDSYKTMKPSVELCVKDCIWMPDEAGVAYAIDYLHPKFSIALGVKTKRQANFSRFAIGIPFGQKEKLTNRLKRILTGYPCDGSIMKELLQNADDAKASKICFIKDPRHHKTEKVFEESWEPLQGPALCVYNDAPFSNRDIEGIQNLGEGSKGDDPNKTGQYGVGFNAVYHLTDAPSFISKGDEIGEVMCVFDPNLQYVPSATLENPGVRIDSLHTLREIYTDVWPCYLEHYFPLDNGTMFRFPLRNKEMAETSKVSSKEVTYEKLTSLVKTFQSELLEALLFVNHISQISIHEVDKDEGSVELTYQVKACISKDDKKKRQEFATHAKIIGNQLRRAEISLSEIPVRKVCYVLRLEDNQGVCQKWLIVQQIGFECAEDIRQAEDVDKAFKKGDLGLLPRGGVACLISSSNDKPPGKAFCFLPLPFKSGLPVHINGHFALDHEARRSLWRSEIDDYRSKWNTILLTQVVAPCYVLMLEEIRKFINLPVINNQTSLKESQGKIESFLENYISYFPSLDVNESHWKTLAQSVYYHLSMKEHRILPVLRHKRAKQEGTIEWLPPKGKGREKAFFDNMKPDKSSPNQESDRKLREYFVLRDTLLAVGFNLLYVPMTLYHRFVDSGVCVNEISPKEVIDFFHSYSSGCVLSRTIGCLPLPIESTPFKKVHHLFLVLDYCKQESNFSEQLNGLPLLSTEDGQLRIFDNSEPVFISRFHGLVPSCNHLFLHHALFNSIFHDNSTKESMPDVFKAFSIAEFAELLPNALDEKLYRSSDKYVRWEPTLKGTNELPSSQWISHVWKFFDSAIRPALAKYDAITAQQLAENTKHLDYSEKEKFEESARKAMDSQKKQLILHYLEPFKHWCLLPATEVCHVKNDNHPRYFGQIKHFLVPLEMAETVLRGSTDSLESVISRISLPQLNCQILRGTEYSTLVPSCEIPKRIVSNVDDGRLFLSVLLQKANVNPSIFQTLQRDDYEAVLKYFDDHITDFQVNDVGNLKSLPLYSTVHGDRISISNKKAFVLSRRIPHHDMDKWEENSGIVFLTEDSHFKKLHSFLGCDSKNEVDVYCDIIFSRFQVISKDSRLVHLTFVRRLLDEFENPCLTKFSGLDEFEKITLKTQFNQGKEKLTQALRKLEFDLSQDGSLKSASSFFDPFVYVFNVMLPEQCFPAKPFCEEMWLKFLRKIGLIYNVTDELFIRFAREVELEGKVNATQETEEKSEALVSHLFSMENVATSPLLDHVQHIAFILRKEIDKSLKLLHPPFSGFQYICFRDSLTYSYKIAETCWTTVNILPGYANPRQHWSFTRNYGDKSRWNDISKYRQEIIRRLGMIESPTCKAVVGHCVKICTALCTAKDNCSEDNVKDHIESDLVNDVMMCIYQFLQDNYREDCHFIQSALQSIRCILVENHLVFPNQVVADLTRADEIRPYLFKIPPLFARYGDLFKKLGATETVTVSQYVMVLDCINMECKGNKLNPNETTSAFKATKGLFSTLAKKGEIDASDMSSLYLPEVRGNPGDPTLYVFLRKSSEMCFNDAPHFKDRLNGFQGHILVKLKECGLIEDNDDRLVNILPELLRPKMLTSIVHEALVEEGQDATFSSTAQDLKNILTSPEFLYGFIRLVKHDDYERDIETGDDIISRVRKSLSCINVYSVQGLRTRLVYQGSTIPESEKDVTCFEERKHEGTKDVCNIYVVENQEDKMAYIARVAEIVDRITGHLLDRKLVYLPFILVTPLDKISLLLDSQSIREDNSYLMYPSIFPKPGSFIHIEDHHLLENAFTTLFPDEYVGYELDDPSLRGENGNPTYIYAIIVEKVSPDQYKIDVGIEHIEVNADKLYRFYRRKQEGENMEIEIFTGLENKEVKPKNLEEAKRQVGDTLENAWGLPEESKRRVIKRLFLTWHPDKNPGNEQFCTEIFKFLQAEIARLEMHILQDQPGRSTYSGHYSDFFNRWSGYAESHRRYRSSYVSRGGRQNYHRKNPQPAEASRWYRQASADFKAASYDISFHEWACFKCHQSAEKALKAAQYAQDADHSSTHYLPEIANSLGDMYLQSLASDLERLLGNSTRMRYPDQLRFPNIPHDMYRKEMAEEALEITKQILVIVEKHFLS